MNFKTFMDKVKSNVDKMEKNELVDFIFELARLTKEADRMDFLQKFKQYNRQDRKAELEKIYQFCNSIENMDICLSCSNYEDYDNDYWGERDWIYEYSDPFAIGKTLKEAFLLAKNLVYEKSYIEADRLYDRLFSLNIFACYEGSDEMLDNQLDIEEAVNEKIVYIDLTEVCNHFLYTAYQATTDKKRIEAIYHKYQMSSFQQVSLEGMLSVGPEPINEIEEFMTEFNKFLRNKTGDLVSRLLSETIPYIKMDAAELARESAAIHPSIYYNLCKEAIAEKSFEKTIQLGKDAIDNVPKKLKMRSKIAYLIADVYKAVNDVEGYNQYMVEGFISDSSPINFLKLFDKCSKDKIDEAYRITSNVPINTTSLYPFDVSELDENFSTSNERSIIRFLNGDFEYAKKNCIMDKEYLGWSTSYKGLCISLFLILLENGNKPSKAKREITNFIIRRIENSYYVQNIEYYEALLQKWKTNIPINNVKDLYINWISIEVDKRVNAVVGGGFRDSYYKGAQLIIYLGQILESNGEMGATLRLVEKYRKLYSRKRAFKGELNNLLD